MSIAHRREVSPNTSDGPATNRKASEGIRYRLADNLKRFRELRGYTQSALADLCDLHKSYVSNVERGTVNISLANLEALAAGLGCAEYELLQKRAETGFIAQALTQK